jgi:hypothetical protein
MLDPDLDEPAVFEEVIEEDVEFGGAFVPASAELYDTSAESTPASPPEEADVFDPLPPILDSGSYPRVSPDRAPAGVTEMPTPPSTPAARMGALSLTPQSTPAARPASPGFSPAPAPVAAEPPAPREEEVPLSAIGGTPWLPVDTVEPELEPLDDEPMADLDPPVSAAASAPAPSAPPAFSAPAASPLAPPPSGPSAPAPPPALSSPAASGPAPSPIPSAPFRPTPSARPAPAPPASAPSPAFAAGFAPAPTPAPAPPPPQALKPEVGEEESFEGLAAELPAEPPPPAAPPSESAQVAVPVEMVEKIAQRVVAQISEKVVREIAWEVIPDLAEALIKAEIERLKAELQRI